MYNRLTIFKESDLFVPEWAYDRGFIKKKNSLLCKLLGHKYQNAVWINFNEQNVDIISVCSRCGDICRVSTLGPIEFVVPFEE